MRMQVGSRVESQSPKLWMSIRCACHRCVRLPGLTLGLQRRATRARKPATKAAGTVPGESNSGAALVVPESELPVGAEAAPVLEMVASPFAVAAPPNRTLANEQTCWSPFRTDGRLSASESRRYV